MILDKDIQSVHGISGSILNNVPVWYGCSDSFMMIGIFRNSLYHNSCKTNKQKTLRCSDLLQEDWRKKAQANLLKQNLFVQVVWSQLCIILIILMYWSYHVSFWRGGEERNREISSCTLFSIFVPRWDKSSLKSGKAQRNLSNSTSGIFSPSWGLSHITQHNISRSNVLPSL